MKLEYKGIKIKLRKDGRYVARTTKNKKRYYIYGKTQKECYTNLKAFLSSPQQIEYQKNKKIFFFDYCEKWLKIYKEPNVTKQSYLTYKGIVKNHIEKHLPNIEIDKITPLMLNEAINKTTGRPKEYISQCLKQIFKQAFSDLVIDKDIQENIIKITHKRKEGSALTKEQRKEIIEKSKNIEHGLIFPFTMYSGCRKGEVLKITFDDIDFENNLLHIPGTKTTGSDRYIPLFDNLKEIIKKLDKTETTLFGISEKTLQRATIKLQENCSFKFMFKDFRTTFGTMCAEIGIVDKTIAKWLGHTNTGTTNKYYIKVLSEFEKEQSKIFNEHFDTNFDTNLY